MHHIIFKGGGKIDHKLFVALLDDYTTGYTGAELVFVLCDSQPSSMSAEQYAKERGIPVAKEWDALGFEDALTLYPGATVMLSVHDGDESMLEDVLLCRELGFDPLDLCQGLIPLLSIVNLTGSI